MKIKVPFSVVIGVAAAMMFTVVAATPASASTTCTDWWDSYTFGTKCSGNTWGYFRAVAICGNDKKKVYGPWRVMNAGQWSYAYCSSTGAHLVGYTIQYK